MRIRKLIYGGVAVAALATILLGLAGVFAPPSRKHRVPLDGEDAKPGVLDITDFIVRMGNLTIRAERATVAMDGATELTQPRLEMILTEHPAVASVGEDTQRTVVRARSDRGVQGGEGGSLVTLSGNVVIEAEGARQGVVKTERLVWDSDTRRGTLEGRVEFRFESPDGTQRGSSSGAEWDLETRSGAMLSEVELVLTGWSLPSPTGEPEEGGTEPAVVRCDGRASLDEIAGLVELRDNVRVRQTGAELEADLLTLELDPETRELREVVAAGDVRFTAADGGLTGSGDRLARRVADDAIELTGDPHCELTYRGATLRAPRLAMRGERVESWGAGEMETEVSDGDEEVRRRRVGVSWEGRMEFSREDRRAEFRRGVVFQDGENRLASRDLTVRFDEAGEDPESVEAVGDVRFEFPEGVGSGDRLVLDAATSTLRLFGRPATLERGEQRFTGDELIVEDGGDVVHTSKPGTIVAVLDDRLGEDPDDALGANVGRVEASWSRSMRYVAQEATLRLAGDVRIEGEEGVLEGEAVTLNQERRAVTVEGEGWLAVLVPPRESADADAGPASLLGTGRSDEPTRLRVSWRKGMSYDDGDLTAVFEEEVRLTHENYELNADTLRVRFDEHRDLAGGDAEGDVRLDDRQRGYSGTGRKLEWEAKEGMAKLWGTVERPAEVRRADGMGVASPLIVFSDDFRTITLEAPESRAREDF